MKMRTLPLATTQTNKATLAHLLRGALASTVFFICLQASGQPSSFAQANNLQSKNLVSPQPLDSGNGSTQTNIQFDSRRQLEDLHRAIDKIELEQGAWGTGLSEQLRGLGKTYQLRGEHEEAIEAFERSIHVNRINQGLYDLSQVNIVEDMLDSLLATRKWKQVHERQQHLYWLYQRNYGGDDPRMLPVIDRLGSWYVNDYALNPNRRQVGNLVDAYNLFGQASSIVEEEFGPTDLRMIVPLRGLVLSNWFLWSYASQNQASILNNESMMSDLNTKSITSFSGNPNRLAPYLRNNYPNGKAALNRMIEIYEQNPEAPAGAAATAKIELADWHMLSRRWRSATDLYLEAYNSLSGDAATKSKADRIFERPVALPDLVLMESDIEQHNRRTSSSVDAAGYVLVSYDVSRFGEAKNIDIVESRPENNVGIRARVKRSIADTRFRPRIVNGEAVETKGMLQKYIFNE